MSSAHSLNKRKGVPAQKHYPSQACAHESSKVWVRRKREEERQKRQRPGGWMKEKQPTKQKHIWGAKTRRGGAKVNKAGRGTVNFPLPTQCDPFLGRIARNFRSKLLHMLWPRSHSQVLSWFLSGGGGRIGIFSFNRTTLRPVHDG